MLKIRLMQAERADGGKKFFCFNFSGEGNGMGLNWDGKEHIHPSILVEMVGKGV